MDRSQYVRAVLDGFQECSQVLIMEFNQRQNGVRRSTASFLRACG